MSQLHNTKSQPSHTKQAPVDQTSSSPAVSDSYKPQHPVLSIPPTVPAPRDDHLENYNVVNPFSESEAAATAAVVEAAAEKEEEVEEEKKEEA